jgi:hypothetical protein
MTAAEKARRAAAHPARPGDECRADIRTCDMIWM